MFITMRTFNFLFIVLFFLNTANAQKSSYGLIKYQIPSNWQEQSRQQFVSYSGTAPETDIPVEIVIYPNQPAGQKPDSSFKMEWSRILDASYGSPAVPYAKKRYNPNGIRLAINIANPVEINTNNQKKYSQLAVFILDKQMQAVQFVTNNATDYKTLRPFIDEFVDTVDSVEELKN